MKFLTTLALLMSILGCSPNTDEIVNNKIVEYNREIDHLTSNCLKLGECMKAKVTLIHFPKQTFAPYACHISLDRKRGAYLYPDSTLGFGQLGQLSYENALTICQIITHQGEYSDQEISERKKALEELERTNRAKKSSNSRPTKIPVLEMETSQ